MFQNDFHSLKGGSLKNAKELYAKGLSYSFVNVTRPDGEKALDFFTESGEAGYGSAYYMVGQMCLQGVGVAKNRSRAREYFNLALERGSPKGYYGLAALDFDETKAKKLYVSAYDGIFAEARDGDIVSMCLVAEYFYRGLGVVERDADASFMWMKKSADLGYADAQMRLGRFRQIGVGCEIDQTKAYGLFCSAAAQGNAEAVYFKAVCLRDGAGCAADHLEAVKLFTLAADRGNPNAEYCLGDYYLTGKYLPVDHAKAYELFSLAAEKGSVLAQNTLAEHFAGGLDKNLSMDKAIRLYKKAAENGDKNARYNLAMSYIKGKGVQIDLAQAAKYLSLSAEQGQPEAMYQLAIMYLNGQGVRRNYQKAARLLAEAMNRGVPMARRVLADCFEKGIGVLENKEKAKKLREEPLARADFKD